MEGREWGVDIFEFAAGVCERAFGVGLEGSVGVWINGLPDCYKTVDVSEKRVRGQGYRTESKWGEGRERCTRDVTRISDQTQSRECYSNAPRCRRVYGFHCAYSRSNCNGHRGRLCSPGWKKARKLTGRLSIGM